jgi:hypothetical protein
MGPPPGGSRPTVSALRVRTVLATLAGALALVVGGSDGDDDAPAAMGSE